MVDKLADRPFRPYAPPTNVVAILQRLRRMNTPPKLTREFLRGAGVSDNLANRVMSTLKFLELVNEREEPTDSLRAIAVAPEDEYRVLLEQTIKHAYQEDFQNVDPTTDPQNRIESAFQRYQPSSQHSRQVILFLGLCREAGIPTADAPRDRQMQERKAKKPTAKLAPKAVSPANGSSSSGVQPAVRYSVPDGLLFGVTEEDISSLKDEEFNAVWAALGTVARARARSRVRAQEAATRTQNAADEYDDDDSDE